MKVGALFAGYGGLELGLREAGLAPDLTWVAESESAPSAILAHHWPHVPNLGDVTKVWSPCQDLSHAGKRAGMRPGTRSGLWAAMCDAIDIIRPRLVVWENVRGALSATAASGDVERCEFCMGDDGEPSLRALGRVLGDLAELGYDEGWCGLRAADVGAPHGRFRVFVVAWPAADADSVGRERARGTRDRGPRPTHSDSGPLLPTPAVNDDANGTRNATARRSGWWSEHHDGTTLGDVAYLDAWGDYGPAIARWEATLGRPAPAPTEPTGKGGAHRLSPAFVEWMMGLPHGWVTDVPGVSRNDQLKALGNGVVPHQAAAAIRHLLSTVAQEVTQ